MKALVDWLCAQRYRTVLCAIALTPLLPVLSTALMVLDTARRGPRAALLGAAVGCTVVALLALVTGSNVPALLGLAAGSLLAGVAVGGFLHWAGVLTLAFQATVLACFLAVLSVLVFGPPPEVMFAPLVAELVVVLESGGASEEQLAVVRGWGSILLGLFAAFAMVLLLGALLLGYWWLKLARNEAGFGAEFRALKLGRVLGWPAIVLVSLGQIWDASFIQNLTPMALFAFLFQGLSVMHAWSHAKRWHPGVIVPVYVLLVTPLAAVGILGLGAVGLLDNVFNLRAPLRAQS